MEVRSRTAAKTVVPRKQLITVLRGTHDKTSLFVIWVVTVAKQAIKCNNVKSKKKAMGEHTET